MLTQERLKELLHYDPETGVFTWLKLNPHATKIKAGDIAGCIDKTKGYVRIKVDGGRYTAHRLAFLYMTGSWPADQVDHIDHIRSNNAWCNLREANPAENGKNRSLNSNNTSGVNGVFFHKTRQRWVVQIWVDAGSVRKQRTLGYFKDFEAAANACREAIKENGYHKNHGLKLVGAA
jgi:hypothetical protein